MDWLR
jgi:hypothetical protein